MNKILIGRIAIIILLAVATISFENVLTVDYSNYSICATQYAAANTGNAIRLNNTLLPGNSKLPPQLRTVNEEYFYCGWEWLWSPMQNADVQNAILIAMALIIGGMSFFLTYGLLRKKA